MCKQKKVAGRILRGLILGVSLSLAWGAALTTGFAQPANDDFASARLIGDGSGNNNDTQTITGNNDGATKEGAELDHAGMPGGSSVWFVWTPEADGIVTFDTFGSDFDTLIEAYDGTAATGLSNLTNSLASNDDVDPAVFGLQNATGVSSIHFPVIAGNTYYIVVDGFNGDTGSYNLNWKRGGARASGEFEFTSTNYFVAATEGRLDYSDDNGNQSVNRDVPGVLITVTRKNGSSGKVLVEYQTQEIIPVDPLFPNPVPAIANEDFISITNQLVFEDYQMSASFIVPIRNNNLSGSGSNKFSAFNVVLTGASLDPEESSDLAAPVISSLHSNAIVRIADPNPYPHEPRDTPTGTLNDQAGSVQFERARYRRTEGVGVAHIRVVRTGGTTAQQQGAVTVQYSINRASNADPGSRNNSFPLSAGSDYARPDTELEGDYNVNEPTIQTLTIPGNRNSEWIDIPIVNDSLPEFNEDIVIELLSTTTSPSPRYVAPTDTVAASGYEVGFQNVAILTIMHDDYPAGAVDSTHNPDYDVSTDPALNPAPGTDGSVYTVAVQPDGKTVFGGNFQNYNGSARRGIARMNTDGSLDTSFNPGGGANEFVSSIVLNPDGKIIIGGGFSAFAGLGRSSLARLNSNGTLDNTFNIGSGANDIVRSVALQSDGKILIAGEFTFFNGTNCNHVARLNADGSVDPTFNPGIGPDGTVFSVAVEASGSVLIGGDFTTVGGLDRPFVARLNANGTVSTNFNSGTGASGVVYSVVPQSDGKILIGGAFRSFNGASRNSIARLNSDGSLDPTFSCGSGANDTVYTITLQPDGKILLGGLFTSINGTRRMGVARLFAHGPVDTSFLDTAYNQFAGLINSFDNLSINSRNYVFALGLENNGNIIIGGSFSKVGGGRGSKDVRPDQYDALGNLFGGNFLDENTRATYRNRNNIARLVGGETRGPGNIEFSLDSYTVDQSASSLFVTLVRTNYTTDTNYLGAVMASFATRTLPPGPGAASESDFGLQANYANPRWGSSWNRTNKLAYTRMQSDGFFGQNSATLPFGDRYNNNSLFPLEGEAFVFLDIAPDAATGGDKTVKLELNRPKGTRIKDQSGIPTRHFYFDPTRIDPLSTAHTDPNLDWSLGGEFIPLGTALGRSSATLTIRGNDKRGTIAFSAPEFVVNEEGTNAILYVSRLDGSKGSLSFQYATADGTNSNPQLNAIRNLDYTPTNGTLTFPDGNTNAQIIRVRILNDIGAEKDETFTVRIFNPTTGATLGNPSTANVVIIDNDYAPGHLNFTSTNTVLTNFFVGEEESVAVVTVTRTGGSLGALTAEVVTVPGGTATENQDYTGVTNTLTWNSGDISNKTFTVPILNDGLVEGPVPESIFLRITTNTTLNGNPDTNILGSRLDASVLIKDDDQYGTFGFNAPTYYANENSGAMLVTIIRTGGSAGTVALTFSNGVSGVSSNLSFVPGEVSKGILIPILDNFVQNPNLTIDLHLSIISPVGALLSGADANLIVVDDESNNEPPGGVDTTFNLSEGANDFVYSLARQPDGKILVGGDFTSIQTVPRNRIARLKTDGTLDSHFSSAGLNFGANGSVRAIAPQSNGRILIGGFFTQINGADRGHIARLNADGSSDITFNPGFGADSAVHAIAETFVAGARKILAVGNFTAFNGVPRHGIVRLNDNGNVDLSFNPGLGISSTNGTVYCLAVQSDGKVVLGGDFNYFNGLPSPHLVRLNLDGSVDASFNPGIGPDASIRAITIQTDNKIVIGGLFTTISGSSCNHIARLNPNGSVDTGFTAGVGANDSVYAIALQVDGKIVLGGEFTQASGVTRNRLTRLNSDGTVDPTINFGTGADNFVAAVTIQPDGKIIIGGGFTEFDGISQPRIARLNGRSILGFGNVEFVSADYQITENGTNAIITVRRTGGTGDLSITNSVFVTVATRDGTAQNGLDYIGVTNTLEFPQGETRQTITIPILDDNLVEPSETVHLTLSNPTEELGLGNQPVATLTIQNDDAAIGFASAAYRVAENAVGGNAIIEIVRTGSSIGEASVDFITTTNGTATPDIDFGLATNVTTVTFADGQTSQTVTVPLINDLEIEGDETVSLELRNVSGAIFSAPIAATLTIVDDDYGPGNLAFLQPTYSVSETGLVANITVIRTNGSTGFIGVKYSTMAGGTATSGVDYAPTNGTISFGPTEVVKTFAVRIFDDAIAEGNETVQLLLSNPTGGAAIAGTNAVPLIIEDNEIALSFSTPAYVVNEGDGSASVTVHRNSGTNETVTVFYLTSDITATNGLDYIGKTNSVTATNTLVFVPGETSKTITIPILEDTLVEGDESFAVRLFGPSGGAQLANPSNAIVTIVDNDSSFSFSTNNFVVDEGGTNVMVTVVRTNTSVGTATIGFATSNLTAIAGADYFATNGTLTFLQGENAKTILIPIVDDASVEGDEAFTVYLQNPGTGAVLGEPSVATINIVDNDAGLRFSSSTYSVSESGVSATITVLRTVVTNTTVSVNYATANGTATDGQDYGGAVGSLTFTNGETAKTFTVSIIDDTAIEGDETVLLTLLAPSPGSAIISPGAAVLKILDNDGSLIVPAGSALISESGPVNGVIDASENVTLYFAFRNTVGANTANLVATLLPGGGVTSPSGAQNYGVLNVGGASVSRPFSFTASGTNGQQILATFHLQDGPFDLGTGTFTYTLGNVASGFTNSGAIIVNDSSSPPTTASPYPSTIDVSGIVGTVTKVSVTLSNVNHTFFDDMDVLLVSPAGQKIILMSDVGGGNYINNRIITFDDNASGYLPDSTVFASGTFKPTDYNASADLPFRVPAPAGPYDSTLSVLNGTNPNGVWSLYVMDDTFFNNGSINNGWSLAITTSSSFTPVADLSITMTDSPDPAATDNDLTYTVTITNHGPSTATGIMITNLLPPGVTFVSQTCHCTNYSGTLVCPLDYLPKDGVLSFNIVVSPNVVGLITNTAVIYANETDPNLLNNTASAITTVDIPRADLGVSISDSPDPVQVNSDLTYSIVVTNFGPAMANNVSLTNRIPPGSILISAFSSQGTHDTNTPGLVIFNWDNLVTGSFHLATVVVQLPAPGTVTNIASAGSLTIDPFKANNTVAVKTSAELPPLELSADADRLLITWGTNAPNYIVESATEISATAVWLPVTNVPVVIENGKNRLIINYSGSSRFFRLSPVAP